MPMQGMESMPGKVQAASSDQSWPCKQGLQPRSPNNLHLSSASPGSVAMHRTQLIGSHSGETWIKERVLQAFVIGNLKPKRELKLLIRDAAACQETKYDPGRGGVRFRLRGDSDQQLESSGGRQTHPREGRDQDRGCQLPLAPGPEESVSLQWPETVLQGLELGCHPASTIQASRGGWDHPSDSC